MESLISKQDDIDELRYATKGEEYDFDGVVINVVSNEHIGETRWSNVYRIVWEENDHFFALDVERGATEYQDDSDFEIDPKEIFEVEPYEVTVIKYRTK